MVRGCDNIRPVARSCLKSLCCICGGYGDTASVRLPKPSQVIYEVRLEGLRLNQARGEVFSLTRGYVGLSEELTKARLVFRRPVQCCLEGFPLLVIGFEARAVG